MYGADIEFLLYDSKKKKVVPVFGRLGGTKDKAIVIDDNFSCLEDNACVELNYAPKESAYEFIELITQSQDLIQKLTRLKVYQNPEARIAGIDKFEKANEFGCVPDYWAYAANPEDERPMPDGEILGKWRCAGGHIHLSYDKKDDIPRWVVARFMDKHITIPLIVYTLDSYNSVAKATKLLGANRRKWYGLPGLYRPKEYGIEYRTLSNFYALDKNIAYALADLLERFTNKITKNFDHLNDEYLNTNWDAIEQAITTFNLDEIRKINLERKY